MSLTLALTLVIVAALLAVVVIASMDESRHRNRNRDLNIYRDHVTAMSVAFANSLTQLAGRDAAETAVVLNALTADRERLVTALLATSVNPQAARTLGLVDQARARTENTDQMREFLTRTAEARVDSEFTTSDGDAIVPVGMAST